MLQILSKVASLFWAYCACQYRLVRKVITENTEWFANQSSFLSALSFLIGFVFAVVDGVLWLGYFAGAVLWSTTIFCGLIAVTCFVITFLLGFVIFCIAPERFNKEEQK